MPLRFEPPVSGPTDLTVVQAEQQPGPIRSGVGCKAEPAGSYHNSRSACGDRDGRGVVSRHDGRLHAAFLAQAGAKPDRLALAEQGIRGNGHMMMLEANNMEVADAIIGWIEGKTR